MKIRDATPEDTAAMLGIYAPIVTDTTISFELTPPTQAEFAARVAQVQQTHRWLVAETQEIVVGYAYAGAHRSREAYRFSVETSVYLHESVRGQGVGRALYEALFESLRETEFHYAYAGITLPNDASIALHTRVGFTPIGTFTQAGYKFDAWHDVAWMQRPIQNRQS